MFVVACTQPGYPGIDSPNSGGGTAKDKNIIAYIDQRLEEEYYWLDEVVEKQQQFNRNLKWDNYLDNALGKLNTNTDDGYVNSKGERVFYSYIRDITSGTRACSFSRCYLRLDIPVAVLNKINSNIHTPWCTYNLT